MANQDHFRKLLIRSALVTSSTIATLVGAQTLMLIDAEGQAFTDVPVQSAEVALPATPATTDTTTLAQDTTGQNPVTIQHATPNIVIIGQSGSQQTTNNTSASNQVIQPPSPVQIAPPAPIIVQQPAPVVVQQQSAPVVRQSAPRSSSTRSSR